MFIEVELATNFQLPVKKCKSVNAENWRTWTSRIKIGTKGYREIVVAISSQLQTDTLLSVLGKLQSIIKSASEHLYKATDGLIFFEQVYVVLPYNMDTSAIPNSFKSSRMHLTAEADIFILDSNRGVSEDSKMAYAPFTLQYGQCGHPGRVMYIPFHFLLDPNVTAVYGKYHQILIHEWAHYRYGVFDEHGFMHDDLYPLLYIIPDGKVLLKPDKIKPTSCTTGNLTFEIRPSFNDCAGFDIGLSFKQRDICSIFLPQDGSNDQLTSSRMFHPGLKSMSFFCESYSHNKVAKTKHNAFCKLRSVMEVIRSSPDFAEGPKSKRPGNPKDVKFSVIQEFYPWFVMALDLKRDRKNSKIHASVLLKTWYDFVTLLPESARVSLMLYGEVPETEILQPYKPLSGDSIFERIKSHANSIGMSDKISVKYVNTQSEKSKSSNESCITCVLSPEGFDRVKMGDSSDFKEGTVVLFKTSFETDVSEEDFSKTATFLTENRLRLHVIYLPGYPAKYREYGVPKYDLNTFRLSKLVRATNGNVYAAMEVTDEVKYYLLTLQSVFYFLLDIIRVGCGHCVIVPIQDMKLFHSNSTKDNFNTRLPVDESLIPDMDHVILRLYTHIASDDPSRASGNDLNNFPFKLGMVIAPQRSPFNFEKNPNADTIQGASQIRKRTVHDWDELVLVITAKEIGPDAGKWDFYWHVHKIYLERHVQMAAFAIKNSDTPTLKLPLTVESWTNYETTLDMSYRNVAIDPANKSLPGLIFYIYVHIGHRPLLDLGKINVTVLDIMYRVTGYLDATDEGQGERKGCCGRKAAESRAWETLRYLFARDWRHPPMVFIKAFNKALQYNSAHPNRILDLRLTRILVPPSEVTVSWTRPGKAYTFNSKELLSSKVFYELVYAQGDYVSDSLKNFQNATNIVDTWKTAHQNGRLLMDSEDINAMFLVGPLKNLYAPQGENRILYLFLRYGRMTSDNSTLWAKPSNVISFSLEDFEKLSTVPEPSTTKTASPPSPQTTWQTESPEPSIYQTNTGGFTTQMTDTLGTPGETPSTSEGSETEFTGPTLEPSSDEPSSDQPAASSEETISPTMTPEETTTVLQSPGFLRLPQTIKGLASMENFTPGITIIVIVVILLLGSCGAGYLAYYRMLVVKMTSDIGTEIRGSTYRGKSGRTERGKSEGATTKRGKSEGATTKRGKSEGGTTQRGSTEGATTESDSTEGVTPSDSGSTEGAETEGEETEGAEAEGAETEGATTERATTEGATTERATTEGAETED